MFTKLKLQIIINFSPQYIYYNNDQCILPVRVVEHCYSIRKVQTAVKVEIIFIRYVHAVFLPAESRRVIAMHMVTTITNVWVIQKIFVSGLL